MRVLALTAQTRLPDLTTFYQHLGTQVSLDVRRLDKAQQLRVGKTLAALDSDAYDRVLIDLPFRHIRNQHRAFAALPAVLFYEEDACQNYLPDSRHFGAFSRFYQRLPHARVVVTGATAARRLREEGTDACFLAKGYDPRKIFAEPLERDIELGFVGRINSVEYSGRRHLLERLAACEPLQILRTEPGAPYRQMLNRIQMFVSADIGLAEYMAKNFEAMACGCLLLAWREEQEEAALGLRDGEHLLLYSSVDELREHIGQLRADPRRLARIAAAGQAWVLERNSYVTMAERVGELLKKPLPVPSPRPRMTWWRGIWT